MSDRIVRASDPVVSAEEILAMRAENYSKRAKIDKFLKDYGRIILAIAITVSGWLMGNVVKPLQQVPGLVKTTENLAIRQTRQDSLYNVIENKLDQGSADRSRMVDILGALAGLQCDQFTVRERRTSKLCGRLLNGELP